MESEDSINDAVCRSNKNHKSRLWDTVGEGESRMVEEHEIHTPPYVKTDSQWEFDVA